MTQEAPSGLWEATRGHPELCQPTLTCGSTPALHTQAPSLSPCHRQMGWAEQHPPETLETLLASEGIHDQGKQPLRNDRIAVQVHGVQELPTPELTEGGSGLIPGGY